MWPPTSSSPGAERAAAPRRPAPAAANDDRPACGRGGPSPRSACAARVRAPWAGRPYPSPPARPASGTLPEAGRVQVRMHVQKCAGTARFLFSARNRSARAKRVPGCGQAYDLRVPARPAGRSGREREMRPMYWHAHRAVPAALPGATRGMSRARHVSPDRARHLSPDGARPVLRSGVRHTRGTGPRHASRAGTRPPFRNDGGPRRPRVPGPVLPCADLEPRALKVSDRGSLSPSDPLPGEDLPPAPAANPGAVSLDGGVLRAGTRLSNKGSIAWRRRPCGEREPEGGARTYGAAR
ncbi:hypothetical protein GA0115241_109225 [Streptomyces sp. DpondAA-D4]|nr:hypothetical protein GA0115241_109225 [Streptomyces sp. DpondAA-D4]